MWLSTLLVPWKHDLDAHLKKYSLSANEVWMFDYAWSLHRPQLLPGVDRETITDGDGRFRISGLGRDRLADLTVTAPTVVQTDLRVMTRDAPDIVLHRDSEGNPYLADDPGGELYGPPDGGTHGPRHRARPRHA